jgi:hypothetical protein
VISKVWHLPKLLFLPLEKLPNPAPALKGNHLIVLTNYWLMKEKELEKRFS